MIYGLILLSSSNQLDRNACASLSALRKLTKSSLCLDSVSLNPITLMIGSFFSIQIEAEAVHVCFSALGFTKIAHLPSYVCLLALRSLSK
jgi:hypothetical protein